MTLEEMRAKWLEWYISEHRAADGEQAFELEATLISAEHAWRKVLIEAPDLPVALRALDAALEALKGGE